MTKTVLLTGAFGNIGAHVLSHLLAARHRVMCLDLENDRTRKAARALGERVRVVWGDLCDPATVRRGLEGVDAVIHMAAIIPPVSERNPQLATRVNVDASAGLIAAMEASPTAKRLVFASSMGVAGLEQHRRQPPLTADMPPSPSDHYGHTKVDCENMIRASGLRWSILRIAACPPLEPSKDISQVAVIFETTADGRTEFVHMDDAGLAFANAVDCDEAAGRILLIGGGPRCQTRALHFYNELLGASGLGPLRAGKFRPGPTYFFGDWLDTRESQELLRYQRHTLEDFFAAMRRHVGPKRHLLRLIAPLANRYIEKYSPYG